MKEDYLGFQFNGVHTSDLNILRVSNGSRYEDPLTPNFEDITARIRGSNETLYWESFFTTKSWNISIAFDNLSELELRKLRQLFNGRDMGELIFDETPYKAYLVKLQAPINLQYICFDKPDGSRVYKGEGTIQFISYKPLARSVYKYLDEYDDAEYPNKYQWSAASGMEETQGNYDAPSTQCLVYNAGDVETNWVGFYPLNAEQLTAIQLIGPEDGYMGFSEIVKQNENDRYIRINSETNLIEGCDINKEPTGSLYNRFLIAGDFFKIPLGNSTIVSNIPLNEIKYNYYYY